MYIIRNFDKNNKYFILLYSLKNSKPIFNYLSNYSMYSILAILYSIKRYKIYSI